MPERRLRCSVSVPAGLEANLESMMIDMYSHFFPAISREDARAAEPDRALSRLGTYAPFPLGEQQPGALVRSRDVLDPRNRNLILQDYARDFFGPLLNGPEARPR